MQNDDFLRKGIEVFSLKKPSIFAYMPIIVGKLFMELPELHERILYQPPFKNGPFLLLFHAYTKEMEKHLEERNFNFVLALESYKYAIIFAQKAKGTHIIFDVSSIDNRMVKETLKRFPNFTLDKEKYNDLIEWKQKRIKAEKEILDTDSILAYMEKNFPALEI